MVEYGNYSRMKVIKATYGPLDVVDIINNNYINDNVISFSVSNDVFGDPTPGGVKEFSISIEDGEIIKTYKCKEGEIFTYPISKKEEERKNFLRDVDRATLLKLYDIKGLGIEVGVQEGNYSKIILDNTTGLHLILLDSWRTISEGYNEAGNSDIKTQIRNLNNTINILIKDHDGRFTIMRELCEVACHFFKDELFDFIYLDANHSEAFVTEELKRWYPKLKPGGMIAGHDYVDRPGDSAFGVKSAVDKFFKEKNLKFEVCDFGCCPTWFNIKDRTKKVSFVCTTYRRFTCVERIVAQYYAQSYPDKELIIFNTDVEHPYSLGFEDPSIIIVNNSIDYQTNQPYTNRGQICRDAVTHATGDYFMLADDDDIYLPWHIEQAVDGITENEKDAWKPEQSFFANQAAVHMVMNTLEASVIVKMDRIREIGFRSDLTGYEGLSWYTKLRDEKQLDEHNKNYVPSYCFNWSDPAEIAGHKQSGDINNPNNFENHKLASTDIAIRPLQKSDVGDIYDKYYNYLRANEAKFNQDYFKKYAKQYL